MSQRIPPRIGCPRILLCIQALYQNGEIDNKTKTAFLDATKKSIKTGNYDALNEIIEKEKHCIFMKSVLDEILTITSSR